MKKFKNIPILALVSLLLVTMACENETVNGDSSSITLGDTTLHYAISQVLQNNNNIIDGIDYFATLSFQLSYENDEPTTYAFDNGSVPFNVLNTVPTNGEWEINTASYPYELRVKGSETIIAYMSSNGEVSIPFSLGCANNSYEYKLTRE